ncbi:MAG: Anabaena sensory rhodopsin transducer [Firmicutes bacterium ADurb.Bin182]|nr:MAG: Anabaena sensory rhodopsin transducer [Firmicutes bacterium ADurb.Bin182]
MTYGKKVWLIPDMYWPAKTTPGEYVSHESVCVINTQDTDCEVTLTLYYEDREPITPLYAFCGARRTHHIRMDLIRDPDGNPIPKGVPYAALVECSVPVVVQYTRVDTTQAANSLMTTMAYPVE